MIKFRIWHKPSQTFTKDYISEVSNHERLRCDKKYLQFQSWKKKKTVKEIFESLDDMGKENFIYCNGKLFHKDDSCPLSIDLDGDVNYIYSEYDDTYIFYAGEEYLIQQCIGLKDKNGVDIYEGDVILDTRQWKIGTIVYGESIPAFFLSDVNGAVKLPDKESAENDYEVIGTIFGLDKKPCTPDHNGECLICDCWLSDCHLHEHLALKCLGDIKP